MPPAPPPDSDPAPTPAATGVHPAPLAQTGVRLVKLVEVMNRLLAPDGCPWDREQTLETLRSYLIEESYEVLEALDAGDVAVHREELGDVLFQIVFQAALRAREGAFGIDDVCAAIEDKMISRHPHVFGDVQVADSAEVLKNWGSLKAAEKERAGVKRRTLDGVPIAMPSLLRAQRLGEKAAAVGFDWPDLAGVRDKLREELVELDEAIAAAPVAKLTAAPTAAPTTEIEHEIGDVLFTMTRLAARLGVSPEDALRGAIGRFCARFNAMEDQAEKAPGKRLKDLTLDQMNVHWEAAKRELG
jgi:tetrapyrrole methylase family protein/MazG family protein